MEIPIPRRVFLDTNVVNFTLDWSEVIFDGDSISSEFPDEISNDVVALHGIFAAGKRAFWELAISPKTYEEIARTANQERRRELNRWFSELWLYSRKLLGDRAESGDAFVQRLIETSYMRMFPDAADRELIADAIVYECDVFCTRDRRSIIRHRDKVTAINIRFLTPAEWWAALEPWAGLWP